MKSTPTTPHSQSQSAVAIRSFGKLQWPTSEIGFGAWAIGGGWGGQSEEDSLAALNRALDLGVNFIDTAAGYGNGKSERLIGRVLSERGEGRVFVATKTPPMAGPWPPSPWCRWDQRYPESYLRANVEERLTNLGVETLDLLQLHTWTRAWNDDPQPLLLLKKLKQEGKIRAVGVSTPEHDQNAVIDLMRAGLVDAVQVIYNIFEQEPAAQLLPEAEKLGVAIIVRVVFDEGVLTGKFTPETTFAEDDFRRGYFAGDRLARTVGRVAKIQSEIAKFGRPLPEVAIRFALDHPAVSTVIPGIRTVAQAEANTAVSATPPLGEELHQVLRKHGWRRAFWYGGK
ncbi:MAG: aldo/keto reductase [Puniceicoccaceae bacterium]|nr:MAG: aldo/keto reductase [Puniceicoccaceae bacterium]